MLIVVNLQNQIVCAVPARCLTTKNQPAKIGGVNTGGGGGVSGDTTALVAVVGGLIAPPPLESCARIGVDVFVTVVFAGKSPADIAASVDMLGGIPGNAA
jgi:hypothetical protein